MLKQKKLIVSHAPFWHNGSRVTHRNYHIMLATLPAVNHYLADYLGGEFRLGIGIAYGPMVTGELGFPLKRQFTAIGDTVNVAARLESATRETQADLLVSDSVVRHLPPDAFEPVRSCELALKGKREPVLAHEIMVRP